MCDAGILHRLGVYYRHGWMVPRPVVTAGILRRLVGARIGAVYYRHGWMVPRLVYGYSFNLRQELRLLLTAGVSRRLAVVVDRRILL